MEFKQYLEKYSALLPLGKSVSQPEAERRAAEFLSAMATITDWRHVYSNEKIKLLSAQTAVYAQEMGKGTAKTVTENKLAAEASDAYTQAREELERIDNDLAYLKAYYEVFMNGHVFYRNVAKGESF